MNNVGGVNNFPSQDWYLFCLEMKLQKLQLTSILMDKFSPGSTGTMLPNTPLTRSFALEDLQITAKYIKKERS